MKGDWQFNNLKIAGVAPKFPVNKEVNQRIAVTKVNITTLQVDAIVNAANPSLLGGGGVDGAIHATAGSELSQECAQLGGCATGQAKITSGYNLPARHVIHTVGPKGENEHDLRNCYNACLRLCRDNKLRSIAFPCISTGLYGYPEEAAAKTALRTVRQWLERHLQDIDCVVFCTFSDKALQLYKTLMPCYFPVEVPVDSSRDLNPQGLGRVANSQSSPPRKAN